MLANGTTPASLVLAPSAELGRRIEASGASHEIEDDRMSREHATVQWDHGTWVIEDLDSRNGTFVNGERIVKRVKRRGTVILRLGHTVFALVGDRRGHAPPADPVIGPELATVLARTRDLAGRSSTLLLDGEPGAGKQLVARVFHGAGPRARGPFVTVACAAIHGVADRLLFGHKKGVIETIGYVQQAHGGTLYLAGFHDLDPIAQAALWRMLEARPDGADADVGIACAGTDLREAVTDGDLRGDLYDHLSSSAVEVPPLRARKVDAIRLAQVEVAAVAAELEHPLTAHPRLLEACGVRPWSTGNVRELRAAVRAAGRLAIGAGRDVVRFEDLAPDAGTAPGNGAETAVERPQSR